VSALQVSNVLQGSGLWTVGNQSIVLEAGDVLREPEELAAQVINVIDGAPVFLRDVARIEDGPGEPVGYSWIDFSREVAGSTHEGHEHPMVAISVAKQRGANAVTVARETLALMERLQANPLPRRCTSPCCATTARRRTTR
jgi:multidrug efflux pump subunit AcrB